MSRSYDRYDLNRDFWDIFWEEDERSAVYGTYLRRYFKSPDGCYHSWHSSKVRESFKEVWLPCRYRLGPPTSIDAVPWWANTVGQGSTPSWWTRRMMNRPRRHEASTLCHIAKIHNDPESLIFPLSKRPHVYYY